MYVGVDVGGTKVLAVETSDSGEVVRRARRTTPGRLASEAELEAAIRDAVHDVADGRPLYGVGVSAAGLVSTSGAMRFAPHLPWRDVPVGARLTERLETRVVVDNDANCAAAAELRWGAARGIGSLVLITVGTGIGGALATDGRVWRGSGGLAGEFGHMQVVPGGLECECGRAGCWEQYCSGRALERVFRVALGSHLDGPQVTALALEGDAVAIDAFASVGTWLGVGVTNLVAAFDPDLVVIGGGVSAVGDLLLDPARETLRRTALGVGHRELPDIVLAQFGPDAGAIGAAAMAAS